MTHFIIMKQYDEREFTLITHEDMKTYQWLIKENIKRNRVNGIVSKIIIYIFVFVVALTAIFMVTKDIFFENYSFNPFDQEERIKILEQKTDEINRQIKTEDDYSSFEPQPINEKVKELESRVDDVKDN